jgi:hypothetical protein
MRTQYHVQRAKRLVDTLREADRLNRTSLATSLLVVSNELAEAQSVLNNESITPRRILIAPLAETRVAE